MRLTLDYSTIQISRKRPENSLSISLILRSQVSQVSRIVHETYAFVGHPTLTCTDTQISRILMDLSVLSAAQMLFSHAHTSEHVKSIVSFPFFLGTTLWH